MVSLGARRCQVTALEDPLGHRQGHRVIHREPQLPRVLPGVQAGVQHLGGKIQVRGAKVEEDHISQT